MLWCPAVVKTVGRRESTIYTHTWGWEGRRGDGNRRSSIWILHRIRYQIRIRRLASDLQLLGNGKDRVDWSDIDPFYRCHLLFKKKVRDFAWHNGNSLKAKGYIGYESQQDWWWCDPLWIHLPEDKQKKNKWELRWRERGRAMIHEKSEKENLSIFVLLLLLLPGCCCCRRWVIFRYSCQRRGWGKRSLGHGQRP